MRAQRLKLHDFRNIQELELEPSGKINVLVGKNAQGKTNILEALWLCTGFKSFRSAHDREFKNYDADSAKIELDFTAQDRQQNEKIIITDTREYILNGVKEPLRMNVVGKFGCVVFAPDFTRVINGGGADRRKYIDTAICAKDRTYARLLNDYTRTLKRRNAVLKLGGRSEILEAYNIRLAQSGVKIYEKRREAAEMLGRQSAEICSEMTGGRELLEIRYSSLLNGAGEEMEEYFLNALRESENSDRERKMTQRGIHLDDLNVYVNSKRVKSYGSQGQRRTAAVSMKLAESSFFEEPPVLLLDDIMSELDDERREYIISRASGSQVFLTCCSSDDVRLAPGTAKIFRIENGKAFTDD